MHPADIICSLSKKKITLTAIAEQEGVSVPVVSDVVHGKKRIFAVATAIAAHTGKPLNKLWPGQYEYTPKPLRRANATNRRAA